ncbi:ATP-grasp domain-containing protein [uncultured Sphaerotilus sp.]|uniref:ATP-grasp domain-containing protein n=1 Tax=uncultured Sphaerotilus sp. TaxID=474984 RepID=UPI0030CA5544
MTLPVRLVIAGLSVRATAEAARRDGFDVVAVDQFGDADTRAAATAWHALAPLPDVGGGAPWLVTSGFDTPGALAALHSRPLLGTSPSAIDRVRDPRAFFAALDARGIAHPAVSLMPQAGAGWLCKDFASSGGQQVQPADEASRTPSPGRYWQQHVADAVPVSLTFIGNGERAALLGRNLQLLHPEATCPWRFGGLIGPLPMTGRQRTRLQGLADRLTSEFDLRGLASLDLLQVEEDAWLVLEINPRLSASLVLYGAAGGLMRAVVEACVHGRLPDEPALQRLRGPHLRGYEIVRMERPSVLDAAGVRALQQKAGALGLHDLPAGPQGFEAGDPLCSIEVEGDTADAVRRALAHQRTALDVFLETWT